MAFRPDIIAGRAVIIVSIQDTIDRELRRLRTTIRRFANLTSTIGGDLFRFGIAGSVGSALPVQQFIAFQDQLLFLQTKLRVTDAQMKDLEETIRSLGRTTSFTPKQVADAATEFAKAGFSFQEVTTSLQAALDLARGGQVDLSTSTALLANNLRTFGLGAEYANIVASKFITTARLGTINIVDLNESLKESSGTFRTLNVGLNESLALIVQLSKSSLFATKAGTSLNTAFQNIASNRDKLKELLDLEFTDAELKKPVFVFKQLAEALKQLGGTQERVGALQQIFNIRGGRAIASIVNQGAEALDDTLQEITASFNEAREASKKLDSQLGGSFRFAKSAFEELLLAVGATAEGPLTRLFNAAKNFFTQLSLLAASNPEFVQTLLIIPPAALAAGAALLVLSRSFGILASFITPILSLNGILFSGFFSLIKLLGTRGSIFAFVFIELARRFEPIKDFFKSLGEFGRNLKGVLVSALPAIELIRNGISTIFTGRIDVGINRIKQGILDLGNILRTGFLSAWYEFIDSLGNTGRNLRALYIGIKEIADALVKSTNAIFDSIMRAPAGSGGSSQDFVLAIYTATEFIVVAIRTLTEVALSILEVTSKIVDFLRKSIIQILKVLGTIPGVDTSNAIGTISDPIDAIDLAIGDLRKEKLARGANIKSINTQIAVYEHMKAVIAGSGTSVVDRMRKFRQAISETEKSLRDSINAIDKKAKADRKAADISSLDALQQGRSSLSRAVNQDNVRAFWQEIGNKITESRILDDFLDKNGIPRRSAEPIGVQVGDLIAKIALKAFPPRDRVAALNAQGAIIASTLGTFQQTRGQLYKPSPVEERQIGLLTSIDRNTAITAEREDAEF